MSMLFAYRRVVTRTHSGHCSCRIPIKMMCMCVWIAMVASLVAILQVEGAPFPAPNLQDCYSQDNCCPPSYKGNAVQFHFNLNLPMRTRQAAQNVDAAYIAKYQRAYQLMRQLPRSDPRSLVNQARLHCSYCGGAFYFPESQYPLEIHDGWFFFAWHRMFLYFHERILAKLIGDDTFALPFWNWDNQSPTNPGNVMPKYFADKLYNGRTSSLYDANRNPCAIYPNIIDLNSDGGCSSYSPTAIRWRNNRLMYNQMVTGPTTSSLFFGSSFRYGDSGGLGGGTVEVSPHGNVHVFTGNPNARNPYDDMGNLDQAALDPLFYVHHANIDRLWGVWRTLPGGKRRDISDPDYLNSAFVFFDENAKLVSMKVGQVLNLANLRYNYQRVPATWVSSHAGVATVMGVDSTSATSSTASSACSSLTDDEVRALIKATHKLKIERTVLSNAPLTFRVSRPAMKAPEEEVLVFNNIALDWSKTVSIKAYLFFPSANLDTSISCQEFFGIFNNIPAANHLKKIQNPDRSWRLGITAKLREMGKSWVSDIVVTLVQSGGQPMSFRNVEIVLDT